MTLLSPFTTTLFQPLKRWFVNDDFPQKRVSVPDFHLIYVSENSGNTCQLIMMKLFHADAVDSLKTIVDTIRFEFSQISKNPTSWTRWKMKRFCFSITNSTEIHDWKFCNPLTTLWGSFWSNQSLWGVTLSVSTSVCSASAPNTARDFLKKFILCSVMPYKAWTKIKIKYILISLGNGEHLSHHDVSRIHNKP